MKEKKFIRKDKKDYINNEIIAHYATANSAKLARRLGITESNLRAKARRLGVRKLRVNDVINGKKLCPHCGLMKDIETFNKDKYQANNFDYYCRSCRNVLKAMEQRVNGNSEGNGFGKGKEANNIIRDGDGKEYLKCKSCNVILPLTEFNTDRKMSHGHRNTCRTCEILKRRGRI